MMFGCAKSGKGSRTISVNTAQKGALLVLSLLVSLNAGAQRKPRAWSEKTLVQRLNRSADHFTTLTAKLEYTKLTAVVDHTEVQTGQLYYRKNHRRILIEFLQPEKKEILFRDNKAEIYYPKMKQIQEFDLSKHRDFIDQFLLLGFGTKGDDLKKAYLITVLGETRLGANAVLLVELTPKDERIRTQIHRILLWFDLASWVPVQQKFFEVGGDSLTTRYTEVKVGVRIPRAKLSLSAPRDTKRVKPRANM